MREKPKNKKLTPEAMRALDEAAERRRLFEEREKKNPRPAETGGPKGPEPTRYGDWERKGILSDF